MATIQLTKAQVLDWVRQAPAHDRREVLMSLAGDATALREQRMQLAEDQLRRLCGERGLDWSTLTEEQREAFVDDLVHEDRSCGT